MNSPARDRMSVTALSPHLDDAALSVGSTLSMLARIGVDVQVVTVFAGDPAYQGPPSTWDHHRRLASAEEVFRVRRREDAAACAKLGARPTWMDILDEQYDQPRDHDRIWATLAPLLAGSDVVLVPGYPLAHPDHQFVSALVLEHMSEIPCLLAYRELPYGIMRGHLHGRPDPRSWWRPPAERADRIARVEACRIFHAETSRFGPRAALAERVCRLTTRESLRLLHGEIPSGLELLRP